MTLIKRKLIDFLSKRYIAFAFSAVLIIVSIAAIATRGLSFGIDFTGGTLIELKYDEAVDIGEIRSTLESAGVVDAVVQSFGSTRDVLIRLPNIAEQANEASVSNDVVTALRSAKSEQFVDIGNVQGAQQCISDNATQDCQVQMTRVEFVGPQVGDELTNQGTMAMLYALIGILIYVAFRFEWRFSIGSVIALVHDVVITVGVFALFQFEFNLPVLAALLAVIGYSLNDTIVVYDRIRENFLRIREDDSKLVINTSLTQTLSRTILTSLTTLFVVLTLLIFGGEVIRGFAIALFVGVLIGTYSSIFVASPVVLHLGVSRADMLPVEKEGQDVDEMP